jgi:hypothetical protein
LISFCTFGLNPEPREISHPKINIEVIKAGDSNVAFNGAQQGTFGILPGSLGSSIQLYLYLEHYGGK